MTREISIGFTCRNVDALPADDRDLQQFVLQTIAPAILQELQKSRQIVMTAERALPNPEIANRGCEVGVSIKL